jgi:hypothetical protein
VAILLGAVWLLLRIKRSRANKRKGQELHGESALKIELATESQPQELEAPGYERELRELPGHQL